MTIELIEVEPGRWRVKREELRPARSDLPLPYVISDEMGPIEQIDGRYYTSKSAFRAVGRANGLTEVGTEKLVSRVTRASTTTAAKTSRREALKKAMERVRV